jgi:CBS domain-containing protein
MTMLVHEVMSTGIVTVQKSDTIRSAVMKMMHRHCGSLPVVEGDNQPVRMITLRDVLLPLYPNNGDRIDGSVHSRIFSRWKKDTLRCWGEMLRKSGAGIS